jgi:hypothetical protein
MQRDERAPRREETAQTREENDNNIGGEYILVVSA